MLKNTNFAHVYIQNPWIDFDEIYFDYGIEKNIHSKFYLTKPRDLASPIGVKCWVQNCYWSILWTGLKPERIGIFYAVKTQTYHITWGGAFLPFRPLMTLAWPWPEVK